jgi:hypothetical protein
MSVKYYFFMAGIAFLYMLYDLMFCMIVE